MLTERMIDMAYQELDMPVEGFDREDYVCIYCGGYQADPENRPTDHIAYDLALTHRRAEDYRVTMQAENSGLRDDIYDLLCELEAAYVAKKEMIKA